MADFYYRYNNASENMILNDAYLDKRNPVTTGLHRRFMAENFNATTKVWTDSATGATITATGNVTRVSRSGDKQYRVKDVVEFDTTARVAFNNDTLSNYTLFTITRYNGPSKGRIVDGVTSNFLSGHHGGYSGVAYHEGWIIQDYLAMSHGMNFFIGTDIINQYYTNGVSRGINLAVNTTVIPPLALNGTRFSQFSDGQLLDILIYDRVLTDLEMKKVEQYLASYYGLMDLSGNLTANYFRTPLSTETSLLVSTTANQNYIIYPSFYITQTGLTFAMWFKLGVNQSWNRIFDFGNGQINDNILLITHGNNIGIMVGPCGFYNVYSNCNDSVWRHLVWTISPDGLTYKFYINKILVTTINSSNYTDPTYNKMYNVPPCHPNVTLRNNNYIFRSSIQIEANNSLNGAIDDFQMYNYALDQASINNIWNMDTGGSLIPKYARAPLSNEISMLVSTANPNYIIYPSFNIAQTGLTFSMWFKAGNNLDNSRLFDFGNGPGLDNVYIAFINNKLQLVTFKTTTSSIGYIVYNDCNDNVWRHLVWTISADGLTWKLYINKVLEASINSSSYSNYGASVAPYYPNVTLRSSNYIGKSNWSYNPEFNGSIHAFQLYNYPLDQTAINAIHSERDFNGTYTLSQFPNIQKLYGEPPFILNPLSTGSGLFTFTSSDTSVATIVDNIVTIVGIGTTTLTALQWSSSITATLTIVSSQTNTTLSKIPTLSNYQTVVNTSAYDLTEFIQKNFQQTVNRTGTIDFGTTVNVYQKNITCESGIDAQITFGKPKRNMWVAVGQGAFPAGYSYDGISWTGVSLTMEGIDVAFNGTIWVVVGRGSNNIAISYDGIIWTEKSSGLFTTDFWFSNIVWNGKMFVATTSNSAKTIVYSYDGISWTVANGANATFSTHGSSVAWNGRKWVGCGMGTYQLGYSIDGMNWSPSGTGVFSGGQGLGVAWNGNMWIAVGTGANNLASSYDGLNWNGLGKGMISEYTEGIAWNGTLWVAVGSGAIHSMAYSYDGVLWYGLGKPISVGRRVSWNGSMFVAVGSGTNTVAYSYNGIKWNTLGSPFSALRGSVAHNGTLENQIVLKRPTYVATGNTMMTSYDGFQWKSVSNPFTTGWAVAYSGNLWVAVGEGSDALAYSLDGTIWSGIGGLTIGKCIAFSGSLWVAGGNALATSTSGYSFSSITSAFTEVNGIVWNGSLWVAVGNLLAWSTNGTTWNTETTPFTDTLYSVSWNGKMFVACGKGINVLCWSLDGKTWTAGTTTAGDKTSILGDKYVCVSWNGTLWISGGYSLVYSYDGKTWATIQNIPFTKVLSIFWDGKKWIAGGTTSSILNSSNILGYSLDSFKWTSINTTSANGIACSLEPEVSIYMNYPSVAVGNGIYYSQDGLSWTQAQSPTIQSPNRQSLPGYCVGWNGYMWIIGINDGVIYSYDGKTWTSVSYSMSPVTSVEAVRAIAWSGTMWVAGDMYYSYDGLDWNRGTTIFTQVNNITWNGFMFMATGSGSHALAYSYDGLEWNKVLSPLTVGYSVAYNGLWVAIGGETDESTEHTMAYSYDGKTWIGLGKLFTTGYSVANNGNIWVATGTGPNSFAYSYNGISWTGLGTPVFNTGKALTWNGSRWIAVGETMMASSIDGRNWLSVNQSVNQSVNGIASQSDKITTDRLSFFSETKISVGVKGTLY